MEDTHRPHKAASVVGMMFATLEVAADGLRAVAADHSGKRLPPPRRQTGQCKELLQRHTAAVSLVHGSVVLCLTS